MKPSQVSSELRRIAAGISTSDRPDPRLVNRYLHRILTAMGVGFSVDDMKDLLVAQVHAFDVEKNDFVKVEDSDWIKQKVQEIQAMLESEGIMTLDLTQRDLPPAEHLDHVKLVVDLLFNEGDATVNVDTVNPDAPLGPENQEQTLHTFVDEVLDKAYSILGEGGERLDDELVSPFYPDHSDYDYVWNGSEFVRPEL